MTKLPKQFPEYSIMYKTLKKQIKSLENTSAYYKEESKESTKNMSVLDQISNRGALLSKQQDLMPYNVYQQMQIWENEINSLEATAAVLIEFKDFSQYLNFKTYAQERGIEVLNQIDNKKFIVIHEDDEREAQEFLHRS